MSDTSGKTFTLIIPSPAGPSQRVKLKADGSFENMQPGHQASRSSGVLLIGSAQGNHIRRDDATISRYHAQLQFDNNAKTWTISDLGSSNGTLFVFLDEQQREHREQVPANRAVRMKEYERWRIEVGNLSIRVLLNRNEQTAAGQPSAAEAAPQASPEEPPAAQDTPYLAVRYPSGWQRNITLSSTSFSIGASHDNDLPLGNDPAVEPHHALLVYEGRPGAQATDGPGWYLLNLSQISGTFLDGQPTVAGKRALLKPKQVITIGGAQIIYWPARERWLLQVYAPDRELREIDLSDSPYTIGSAADNDYVVDTNERQPDDEIAPYHAQLLETAQGWALYDLGGPSGIRINTLGMRPFAKQLLRENSEFEVGSTTFVIIRRGSQIPLERRKLSIQLDTLTLYGAIGETVTSTVEVKSDKTDKVELQAELRSTDSSAPPARTKSWMSMTSRQLSLDPGERSFVELAVQIPRDLALVGRSYTLEVICLKGGTVAANAQAALTILPRLELQLTPRELSAVAGSATTAQLTISNHTAALEHIDLLINPLGDMPAHWLRFEEDPVPLQAGESRSIALIVQPDLVPATMAKRYAFEVIGRSSTLGEARAPGELVLSAPVSVRLEPGELTVVAGQAISTKIDIAASLDEDVVLTVEGLPEQWVTLSERGAVAKPGSSSKATLLIQTDWSEGMPTGPRPFQIVGTTERLGRIVSEATLIVQEPIQLTLAPSELALAPGQPAELLIDIAAHTDAQVDLSVKGLPSEWVRLSTTQIELQAKDRQAERLEIHPPATARLGDYAFQLIGRAAGNGVLARASALLRLVATPPARPPLLALDQTNVTCAPGRPASFSATIVNGGPTADTVRLSLPTALANWQIPPLPELRLAAGTSHEVTITLEPQPKLPPGTYVLPVRAESQWLGQAELALSVVVPPRAGVRLRTSALRTMPGQPTTTELEVRSEIADDLQFALVGPVKNWARFEPALVRLAPGQTEIVQLTITPPVEHAEALGSYNFQILARGRVASQEVAEAELTVVAPPQVLLDSQTLAVAIGQQITCDITVTSNADTDDLVLLSAEPDKPVGRWATFSEARLSLPPRATRQVQLSITIPRRATDSAGSYPLRLVAAAYHGGRTVVGATLNVLKPNELRLDSSALTTAAGQSIATTISVTNTGAERDYATLALEGPPRNWASFTPPTLQLEPGETGRATLTIQVPREPEGHAAVYDFAVAATWERSPARPYRNATLTIAEAASTSEVEQLRRTSMLSLLLSEQALAAEAGQTATATLVVRNLSRIVDRVSFSVRGIREDWVSFAPSSVALLPNDTSEITMQIQPPRDWSSSAGVHNFTVLGISEHDPHAEALAPAALHIRPFSEFTLDMQPRQQTHWRRGRYNLRIVNHGNYGQAYDIGGHDEEDQVLIDKPALRPVLEPGAQRSIPIEVTARRWLWYGVPKIHSVTFQVAPLGSASGGEAVAVAPRQEQAARFIQQPVFSIGVVLLLGLLLLALLAPLIMAYWNRALAPAPIALLRPTVPPLVEPSPVATRLVFLVQTPIPTTAPTAEPPTPAPQLVTVVVTEQVISQVVVTAPPQPTVALPTAAPPEPTPTSTPAANALCERRAPIELRGSGTPARGVLLYFNGRAVAGTTVGSDGIWSMLLSLSDESPRTVVVRDRLTQAILFQKTCA